MLTFRMTQTDYDANFATMNLNGEKAKIEIIDNDENLVKAIDVSVTGTTSTPKSQDAISYIMDIKVSGQPADHNGWYLMGETERTMTAACWMAITNAGLNTIWTNAFGTLVIPAAAGYAIGIASATHALGQKVGSETTVVDSNSQVQAGVGGNVAIYQVINNMQPTFFAGNLFIFLGA